MRYFFELNKDGNPIEGSNRKLQIMPRNPNKIWKEFIPQSILCCTTGVTYDSEVMPDNGKGHYYVRLDENNSPVSGTLKRLRIKPINGQFQFQEVTGNNCCTGTVVLSNSLDIAEVERITGIAVQEGYIGTPGVANGTGFPTSGEVYINREDTTDSIFVTGHKIKIPSGVKYTVRVLTSNLEVAGEYGPVDITNLGTSTVLPASDIVEGANVAFDSVMYTFHITLTKGGVVTLDFNDHS